MKSFWKTVARGETIEVVQQMSDPPLTHHPETKRPLRKAITAPAIAGRWSDMKAQTNLSDKKLNANGFTKYVKMGDGIYEKRAGKGPILFPRIDSRLSFRESSWTVPGSNNLAANCWLFRNVSGSYYSTVVGFARIPFIRREFWRIPLYRVRLHLPLNLNANHSLAFRAIQ